MRRAEGVVLAFAAAREAGDATPVAQPAHRLAAAGKHLVAVGLVADVPDDAVMRRVEHVMERDRQLDSAEIGRQVAARARYRLDQEGAQFVGEGRQLPALECAHVGGGGDAFQVGVGGHGIRRSLHVVSGFAATSEGAMHDVVGELGQAAGARAKRGQRALRVG